MAEHSTLQVLCKETQDALSRARGATAKDAEESLHLIMSGPAPVASDIVGAVRAVSLCAADDAPAPSGNTEPEATERVPVQDPSQPTTTALHHTESTPPRSGHACTSTLMPSVT